MDSHYLECAKSLEMQPERIAGLLRERAELTQSVKTLRRAIQEASTRLGRPHRLAPGLSSQDQLIRDSLEALDILLKAKSRGF